MLMEVLIKIICWVLGEICEEPFIEMISCESMLCSEEGNCDEFATF